MECAKAIENAIAENFNNNHFQPGCVKPIIEKFGFDRVNFILRYNLKENQHDLRYSEKNRVWGNQAAISDSNKRSEYLVNSHPVLLNAFVDEARDEWDKLNLFDSTHCDDITGVELEGKILVISSENLVDRYKTPEDQLFMATSGFGCFPYARGRAVFGYFIKDDERYCWNRNDFIGILKEQYVPDWVKEKLNISEDTAGSLENSGISM